MFLHVCRAHENLHINPFMQCMNKIISSQEALCLETTEVPSITALII